MMRFFIFVFLVVGQLASAICECGYYITDPTTKEATVFMDRLETNFNQVCDISRNRDWVRQQFTVSAESGRGDYGKAFTPKNVRACMSTPSEAESGLALRVGSIIDDGTVSAGEIDTARLDLHWGSFRAGIKLTAENGTCAAFFWYFNDTQEIDIEFLSREFDHQSGSYPINLVVQSLRSLEAGYDASKTGTYKRVNLDFNPTDAFHEYRFDYTPNQVLFYADSRLLARMEGSDIPSTGGHLILQHWSNGNQLWSGGPPVEDATITVSYVKAYFNSSNSEHQSHLKQRCLSSSKKEAMCMIPDVTRENATTGGKFFSDAQALQKEEQDETNGAANSIERVWFDGLIRGLGFIFMLTLLEVGFDMIGV